MWSESIFRLSTAKVVHQRFWANGRSMLTVMMSTPGRLAAASLKRLVCASHTGVSSEGITLMMRTRLPVSFRVTALSPLSIRLKSGAASPTLSSGPTSVRGAPFIVVAPALSIFLLMFSVILILYQLGELSRLGDRQAAGVVAANVGARAFLQRVHGLDGGDGGERVLRLHRIHEQHH